MNKLKKIKIYTHHGRYFKIPLEQNSVNFKFLLAVGEKIFGAFYTVGLGCLKAAKWLAILLLDVFYLFGSLIAKFFIKVSGGLRNDFNITKKIYPKRFALLSEKQFYRAFTIFLIITALAWVGMASLRLIAKALGIKTQVLQTANLGNGYLTQAKTSLEQNNFTEAENRFSLAYQTFNEGQAQLASSNAAFNQLLSLLPQKQSADSLLRAASLVSSVGKDFVDLQRQASSLRIGSDGITSGGIPASEVLQNINASLEQAIPKIAEASQLASKVDENSLPTGEKEKFVELKDQLQTIQLALNNFNQISQLAESLLSGDKNVLLLFENNNELRAGGGFMGTYGDLQTTGGQINKMTVSSIYDLDGQLQETIQPPQPLLNVGPNWFLRDSNWFADFPTTAQKITSFYEKEGGETPDIIIALTPNLIIDWLKITGPLNLPKYGVTLTTDNFVEQTQAATTISDDLPTNSPKQILADLFPLLLQKLNSLDKSYWPQIIQSLQDNLNNKQIVVYSRDSATENQLADFHWSGNILSSDRDYLSVVTSNLGGTKTDLSVDQKINLTTTIGADGTITDELDITRTNKMPGNLDGTGNDSYIRVYAPLGSRLISNLGFDYKKLDYPADVKYKIDEDVYNWEKNSVTDNLTGTTIGQETGKTFFGNWLKLEGGDSKTVKMIYQLPFKLSDIDRYSLLLQKQIGSTNSDFNWTLNFAGRSIAWKNFDTQNLNTDSLNSDIILNKDFLLGLVLQKR